MTWTEADVDYLKIIFQILRRVAEGKYHNSFCLDQDSNPTIPEYETVVQSLYRYVRHISWNEILLSGITVDHRLETMDIQSFQDLMFSFEINFHLCFLPKYICQ